MLLQEIRQHLANELIHRTADFFISKFGFSLTLKLRLHNLHRNNRCQTFAEIIPGDFNFFFRQQATFVRIFLQGTGQRTAETCQMCTSFVCIDIVDVRVYVFVVGCVVVHGHFHWNTIALTFHAHDRRHNDLAITIDILHKTR